MSSRFSFNFYFLSKFIIFARPLFYKLKKNILLLVVQTRLYHSILLPSRSVGCVCVCFFKVPNCCILFQRFITWWRWYRILYIILWNKISYYWIYAIKNIFFIRHTYIYNMRARSLPTFSVIWLQKLFQLLFISFYFNYKTSIKIHCDIIISCSAFITTHATLFLHRCTDA